MKTLITILFLSVSIVTNSQPADSLKKYSYYLMGYLPTDTGIISGGGTGFFIKRNNELFLITAKHVLSGCDGFKKPDKYPDVFNAVEKDKDLVIPFSTYLVRDTALCLPFHQDPDIIAIKIDKKWYNSVNSVEGYNSPPFLKLESTEIFGFPSIDMTTPFGFMALKSASHIHLPKKDIYKQAVDSATGKILDSINYRIFSKTVAFNLDQRGYSGSPVFVKDYKSKKWRIAGVAVGYGLDVSGETFLYVVNIKYVYKKIDEILN